MLDPLSVAVGFVFGLSSYHWLNWRREARVNESNVALREANEALRERLARKVKAE